MSGNNDLRTHAAFGDTDRANGVPDCPGSEDGPVYLEGRLVLSLSFQGGASEWPPIEASYKPLERYRLWDDLSQAWYDSALEVQRFELADVVVSLKAQPMSLQPRPTILWTGAVDTRARVIPKPDLDLAGMAANQEYDLRWKRV